MAPLADMSVPICVYSSLLCVVIYEDVTRVTDIDDLKSYMAQAKRWLLDHKMDICYTSITTLPML